MKYSAETQAKVTERDAARARLAELQTERTTLEATINDTTAQLSEFTRKTAAQLYLEGKSIDIAKLTETRTAARARLAIITEAIELARANVGQREGEASRSACTDMLPEYQKAQRAAALALVAALVAIHRARKLPDALVDKGFSTAWSWLAPLNFCGMGPIEDNSARWTWWMKDVIQSGGVTVDDLRQAFGEFWPIARKSLHLEGTPLIAKAARAVASALAG